MPCDIEARNECVTFRRRDQRRQHPDDRGFAGAVGTEQSEDLAATDFEADFIDRGESAEALSQLFGLYC